MTQLERIRDHGEALVRCIRETNFLLWTACWHPEFKGQYFRMNGATGRGFVRMAEGAD